MRISREAIEIAMAEKRMTGKTLAEAAGFSRQALSAIMCRGTCSPITAGKIAEALGVPVAELTPDRT